jgi:tetratricopeptide (TPR) repeat protein
VTGTVERLVTGDVVNVAARLEQVAPVGEVLVGEATMTLVGGAVEADPAEPLRLKGKTEPVVAFRLTRVHDVVERRGGGPFVGREFELGFLERAWERVRVGDRCELLTVVGEAGIGKSRLAEEFVATIDATVVRGRCLPYGEGITYWPVVEVVKQLGVVPAHPAAAMAIRSLLGETEEAASADETAWAFRKTLEQAAAERPVLLVFDDIQWGQQTFLDLVEHVALLSSGAPIMLLCMARPELAERSPTWSVSFRLEPLRNEDVERLIPHQLPAGLRARIARVAGGNPLFIQETLPITGDAGEEMVVPATLRALLAARLDQVDVAERRVLERGAIEGEIFHRGAVEALGEPGEPGVTHRLAALVREQLIQPVRPLLAGEDGFRFRHLLICDAAYDAMPKRDRAELHRRFAAWLVQRGSELVELDELVGYHLEQACAYRASLGMPTDPDIAAPARLRLTAAGRRAQQRGDYGAASGLLERAAALTPVEDVDLALESDLIDALFWSGTPHRAVERAETIAERARATGDTITELCMRIQAGIVRVSIEPEGAAERLADLVAEAQPAFEAAGDDLGLYNAWYARAQVEFEHARGDAALDAYERAAMHARLAGLQQEFLDWRALCRFYGTTPVDRVLEWLDEHEPRAGWDHWGMIACRAHARSMMGDLEAARAIFTEARAELADRGGGIGLAVITAIEAVSFECLAGRPAVASELGVEGCRMLEGLGDQSFLSTAAALLAEALYELHRDDDANAWVDKATELGASGDLFTQMSWRQVKAKLLARAGRHADAEQLALDAVSMSLDTDFLIGQGTAHADLAEVLAQSGRPTDATTALSKAEALFQRKGNVVSAQRARERAAQLAESA